MLYMLNSKQQENYLERVHQFHSLSTKEHKQVCFSDFKMCQEINDFVINYIALLV